MYLFFGTTEALPRSARCGPVLDWGEYFSDLAPCARGRAKPQLVRAYI